MHVKGRSNFVIKEKLSQLKEILRRWNKDVFGKIDLEIEDGIIKLKHSDFLLDSCRESLVEDIMVECSIAIKGMWERIILK